MDVEAVAHALCVGFRLGRGDGDDGDGFPWVAGGAVKLYKKYPEMLSILIFGHEAPEGVETAADCRDRMGR